jgi:hypothetical protein
LNRADASDLRTCRFGAKKDSDDGQEYATGRETKLERFHAGNEPVRLHPEGGDFEGGSQLSPVLTSRRRFEVIRDGVRHSQATAEG